MNEYIVSVLIASTILVFINSAIFYEIIGLALKIITKYHLRMRSLMFLLVAMIFFAHTSIIWIYAFVYWFMVHFLGFKALGGIDYNDFWGYIYFSATTYSSLGIGDIVPYGAMRFVTAVQVSFCHIFFSSKIMGYARIW
jgi:hypothetical protein